MQTKHSSSCDIAKILAQYQLTSYMDSDHAILGLWYHVVLSPYPLRWLLLGLRLSSLPLLLLRRAIHWGFHMLAGRLAECVRAENDSNGFVCLIVVRRRIFK